MPSSICTAWRKGGEKRKRGERGLFILQSFRKPWGGKGKKKKEILAGFFSVGGQGRGGPEAFPRKKKKGKKKKKKEGGGGKRTG